MKKTTKPAEKPKPSKPPKKSKHNLGNFKIIPKKLTLGDWPRTYNDPDLC